MPQLAKGGKWVFGWSKLNADGILRIPPAAWKEYGFEGGQMAIFIHGSQRSGGFSISTPALWPSSFGTWENNPRVYGQTRLLASGRVQLPPEIGLKAHKRLLVIRGSGNALGFSAYGPIYQIALKHTELSVFESGCERE